jgi:hypothetical protein
MLDKVSMLLIVKIFQLTKWSLNLMLRLTIKGFKTNAKIFIPFTIIIILIIAFTNDFNYLIFILFITMYGLYKESKDIVKNREIRRNKKKYKRLSELFNNRLNVTKVTKEKVTIFSNELTLSDLLKNKEKFELYFNKKIAFIQQNKKDFRYNDLIFSRATNFKKYYKFDEYLKKADEKKIKKMQLPCVMGVDEKEDLKMFDFAVTKNLFVAGEPGGGKSVFINTLIQSLMIFNPNSIYIMIDLKEGIELSDYIRFPNTITASNYQEFEELIKIIDKMMINRLRKIRNTDNCKNIFDYNAKSYTENMTEFYIIIDELAEIKLNSSTSSRSEGETKLLQIGQKGRAAGMYLVGATQRPSAEQINTDLRAVFQKALSFCVSTKETQKMTKIPNTETLKTGEFKTNIFNDVSKIYKSLLVASEANKKAGLPKCNQVFEDLQHIIEKEKFFIEILEKKDTKVYSFWHRITRKLNKDYHQDITSKFNYRNYIKTVSKSVKKQVEELKKLAQITDDFIDNTDISHGDNYIPFLKFLMENKQQNNLIPSSQLIMKKLKLSSRKKEEFLKRAEKDNYIQKRNKTRFEINETCKKWSDL